MSTIKKGVGTRDHRSEPDEAPTGENLRVDRVFAGPPAGATKRASTGSVPVQQPPRRSGTTLPPQLGTAPGMDDAELALRRQLSRLQRQLADAQRELANKDDELAATVEKRVDINSAYEETLGALRDAHQRLEAAQAETARLAGVEQRLQDSVATADELNHQLERERAERKAMQHQFEESNAGFEKARALWKDETALLEEHHAAEVTRLEAAKRAAIEAAETAMNASKETLSKAHDAELDELRAAHERSLAALRGELEPKVAEARNLSAEIERLNSEIAAVRAEHMREMAERNELNKWETQQATEAADAQLAAAQRKHESELARAAEELKAKVDELGLAERNAALREQLWEQTTSALRDSQKKLQQELAELKEKLAQEGAGKWTLEQRLVTALQQVEQLTAAQRDLEMRIEVTEKDARRNALDRQRFAAYLEEGLAMLGAIPPTAESRESGDSGEMTIEAGEPEAEHDADASNRPTVAMTSVSDPTDPAPSGNR